MNKFREFLKGGDLRSIGKANEVSTMIEDQQDFDRLMECLKDSDRKIRMRAADAIEKITLKKPEYLQPHKKFFIHLAKTVSEKEMKWHLAQLFARLEFSPSEKSAIRKLLYQWAADENESKIVRVFSIQTLSEIPGNSAADRKRFMELLDKIEQENIPSLKARIKKIRLIYN